MKKFVALFLVSFAFCSVASAEAIVVIDQNGTVIRQMITSPATYVEQPVIATTVPTQTVTVVRESPIIENSYYYDSSSTNAAIAAGVTTAVVGGLLFHGFRSGHHHHHHHGGKPAHHGGGKSSHHGGHRR